ncbi:hypothetical protein GH714_029309 [Hevea brasiliensis]|uniref:F-box domain-containing protein n=1 Tax=Hevea brasiliensis TaxID=3981 RepID=A0A6A6KWA0_HEVBR|nr:hypothetical protein GH714_029309 [Hevea brasiliensis]
MALNFSHRPLFPGHLPDENLVSPMRIANGYLVDGIQDKVENYFDYGRDRTDRCGSQESVHKDILDLLPSDPFGMDISTTFTAITGWLEDLEVDYGGYGRDQVATSDGNYQLFAGLNFIWNNAMRFQAFPENVGFDNGLNAVGLGSPHAAFAFALGYLGVRDLLVVEMVCKSLRSTVRNDPLLWRSIHIDQPLNDKITDDVLLQLTNVAQGNLQCLSLIECPRITDDGLKHVLQNNPRLIKLSVPGCTRLSIEGIVSSLKAFKTMGTQGVKHLRIGGLYGVTQKHFEELMLLLGTDKHMQQNAHKPHFYQRGNFYLSCEDDRTIDIEVCPRCQNLRLVYDCPAEGCQQKEHSTQACRACTLCILRCVQCGRCINDNEYVETFCLELLCSDCWKQLQKCQEKQDSKISAPKSPPLGESSCSLHLHG